MRTFVGALALWVGMIGTMTGAQANCLVIDALDRMHAVQFRLARNPDTPLFSSKIRLLRKHMETLENSIVLDAIDTNALTAKGATFLRFLRNARQLSEQTSIDEPNSVRRHFQDPNVRTNLQTTRKYLAVLRCSAAQLRAAEMPDASGENDLMMIWHRAAVSLDNGRNTVIALVGLVAFVSAGLIYSRQRKRDRRKSKRYKTLYETAYRVGRQTNRGAVLNVSTTGAKLQHRTHESLVTGGSIEIFIVEKWIAGYVVWSDPVFAGILFKTPQDSQMVQQVRQMQQQGLKAAA